MRKTLVLLLALLVTIALPATAGERVDLLFSNLLAEEIVTLRVQYTSAYEGEEPRHSSNRVTLPAGAENWRTGVQGVTLPERIIVDLAAASYVFDDLAGLAPANEMYLEIAYEDGFPVLRRTDGDEPAAIQGEERKYLTDANRRYAVDRDSLTAVTTWDELGELVVSTISDVQGEDEEEAAVKEIVFTEENGWGDSAYFPVAWMDRIGVARVQQAEAEDDSGERLAFGLRFGIADAGRDEDAGENVYEQLDAFLSDLRVDGYRPWNFRLRTWDEELGEAEEIEQNFPEDENDGDKYDHQDALQEPLFAAYADGGLSEASVLWVPEEDFDTAKKGEELPATPVVMTMFSAGTFEAVFVPDGRMYMQ